eukprot:2984423-Amphidinium_carterae.1
MATSRDKLSSPCNSNKLQSCAFKIKVQLFWQFLPCMVELCVLKPIRSDKKAWKPRQFNHHACQKARRTSVDHSKR